MEGRCSVDALLSMRRTIDAAKMPARQGFLSQNRTSKLASMHLALALDMLRSTPKAATPKLRKQAETLAVPAK